MQILPEEKKTVKTKILLKICLLKKSEWPKKIKNYKSEVVLNKKNKFMPWLVWLSGLSAGLQTRVTGSIPRQSTRLGCGPGPPHSGVHERQTHIDVSLFLLPFPSV